MGLLDDNNIHPTPEKCPLCKQGTLIRRPSRYGRSATLVCSRRPNCKYLYAFENTYNEKAVHSSWRKRRLGKG